VLDLYERVWSSAEVAGQALRWRIEHAQHIHADDIPRFAQLGVIASIQGVHATSDGPWIASRLGEERTEQTSYRWRDLLDSGATVNNGTDVPVESIDPFASIYASVTRTMNTGTAFYPDQAMTRYEALYSYTMANAYAAFEEHAKGSLTPGKLADLVVIDQDLMTIDAERIPEIQVHYTIVGGEVRYQRAPQ
jgi:predicted amidohydrolase YtcJ